MRLRRQGICGLIGYRACLCLCTEQEGLCRSTQANIESTEGTDDAFVS